MPATSALDHCRLLGRSGMQALDSCVDGGGNAVDTAVNDTHGAPIRPARPSGSSCAPWFSN